MNLLMGLLMVFLSIYFFLFIHELGHFLPCLIIKKYPEKLEINLHQFALVFDFDKFTDSEIFFIVISGICMNLFFALIFLIGLIMTHETILLYLFLVNACIAIAQLLPIGKNDGAKILHYINAAKS